MFRGQPPAPDAECATLLQKAGENGEHTVDVMLFAASTQTTTGNPGADRSPGPTGNPGSAPLGQPRHGLSAGVKAGISVSVIATVIFALLGAMFLFRRRRTVVGKVEYEPFQKPELDDTGVMKQDRYHEAPTATDKINELPTEEHPLEAPALNDEPVELPVEERPVEVRA